MRTIRFNLILNNRTKKKKILDFGPIETGRIQRDEPEPTYLSLNGRMLKEKTNDM
jgi:hypothetical protein